MLYRSRIGILLLILVTLLGIAACMEHDETPAEQQTRETEVQVGEVRSALESSLYRAESHLDDLEENLQNAKGEVREELRQTIAAMREERSELAELAAEVTKTDATFAATQELRDSLQTRLESLEAAITEARFVAMETSEDLEDMIREQLSEVDEQIDFLENRLAEARLDTLASYQKALRNVQAERDTLVNHYGRLETATRQELSDIREDLARASFSLERTLRHTAADIEDITENID